MAARNWPSAPKTSGKRLPQRLLDYSEMPTCQMRQAAFPVFSPGDGRWPVLPECAQLNGVRLRIAHPPCAHPPLKWQCAQQTRGIWHLDELMRAHFGETAWGSFRCLTGLKKSGSLTTCVQFYKLIAASRCLRWTREEITVVCRGDVTMSRQQKCFLQNTLFAKICIMQNTNSSRRRARYELFFFNFFQNLWETVNLSSKFLFTSRDD